MAAGLLDGTEGFRCIDDIYSRRRGGGKDSAKWRRRREASDSPWRAVPDKKLSGEEKTRVSTVWPSFFYIVQGGGAELGRLPIPIKPPSLVKWFLLSGWHCWAMIPVSCARCWIWRNTKSASDDSSSKSWRCAVKVLYIFYPSFSFPSSKQKVSQNSMNNKIIGLV